MEDFNEKAEELFRYGESVEHADRMRRAFEYGEIDFFHALERSQARIVETELTRPWWVVPAPAAPL